MIRIQKVALITLTLSLFTSCSFNKEIERIPASLDVGTPKYCLSLRGNGQRMMSLWGASARVIESYGKPTAISGGSSGTLTMFLLESVYMNEAIQNEKDEEKKKEKAAFLIKSFMGYISYLRSTSLFENIEDLLSDPKSMDTVNNLLKQMETAKDSSTLKKIFINLKLAFRFVVDSRTRKVALVYTHSDTQAIMSQKLFNDFINAPEEVARVEKILDDKSIDKETKKRAAKDLAALLEFRKSEFQLTLKYFGNYNVQDNTNIFFRPGPMSFDGFTQIFNRMANFYAQRGFEKSDKTKFSKWINSCSQSTVGKTWESSSKKCQRRFNKMVKSHLSRQKDAEKGYKWITRNRPSNSGGESRRVKIDYSFPQRRDDPIAQSLITIPTTGLIKNKTAKKFKELQAKYYKTTDPNFGADFHSTLEDLGIGYWGSPETLALIEKRLKNPFYDELGRYHDFSEDFKSTLFTPLPRGTWRDVFNTSPVEPGLSNLQPIPDTDYVSIGGWMDHLSAPVLKAMGCPHVVTVTKGDGGGRFATSVLKRVLDLQDFTWEELPTLTLNGDASDNSTVWGKYFNAANPKSSYNVGLRTADAIVCANYDLIDLNKLGFKAFNLLFEDGYGAPIAFSSELTESDQLKEHQFSKVITKEDLKTSKIPYVSCFPKN